MIDPRAAEAPGLAAASYDRTTIALHWLVALAVLLTYGFGLVREAVPKGPSRDFITLLHVSFGLTVLVGVIVRLFWRGVRSRWFREPVGTNRLSTAAHVLLYVGMAAIPVAGVLMLWFKGRGIPIFGLYELASPFAANRAVAKLLEEGHELAAHALMLLAGLHAAAALFHHYVRGDGVLGRMIPRFR